MDYVEKTIRTNYVYQGKILSLRRDDVCLHDGSPAIREIIDHDGGACVLFVEQDKVLFVKQYRYAYGESVLEIPAGKLKKGEDPSKAAARELEEEAGIKAEELQLLHVMYPTPGYTNEKIYIYQAKSGKKTATRLDDGEFLQTLWLPLEEVKKMLESGEIKDGKTINALQAYLLKNK